MIAFTTAQRTSRDAERAYDDVLRQICDNWRLLAATTDPLRRSSVMVATAALEDQAAMTALPHAGPEGVRRHQVCRDLVCMLAIAERAMAEAAWIPAADLTTDGTIWRQGGPRPVLEVIDRPDSGRRVTFEGAGGVEVEDVAFGGLVQTRPVAVNVTRIAGGTGADPAELTLWEATTTTGDRARIAELLRELAGLPAISDRYGSDGPMVLADMADQQDHLALGHVLDLDEVIRDEIRQDTSQRVAAVWVVAVVLTVMADAPGWLSVPVLFGGFAAAFLSRFGLVPFLPGNSLTTTTSDPSCEGGPQ
jgi:hypothetical protein